MVEENSHYQNILDELIEYKKLTKKLENELIYKENQLSSINKLYNNSKSLSEQFNNENNNLKKKISFLEQKNKELSNENDLLNNQINEINFQHQKEIKSLKNINDLINNNSILNKDELNKNILELEKIKKC